MLLDLEDASSKLNEGGDLPLGEDWGDVLGVDLLLDPDDASRMLHEGGTLHFGEDWGDVFGVDLLLEPEDASRMLHEGGNLHSWDILILVGSLVTELKSVTTEVGAGVEIIPQVESLVVQLKFVTEGPGVDTIPLAAL